MSDKAINDICGSVVMAVGIVCAAIVLKGCNESTTEESVASMRAKQIEAKVDQIYKAVVEAKP
jgi:uncharacterized membrane protein